MNSFVFVAVFAFFTCAVANPVLPGFRVIEGPSSKTTVVASDGTVVDSVIPGGKIITAESPAVVAETPVVPAPLVSTYTAPLVPGAAIPTPVVSPYSAPILPGYTGPVVTGGVVAGPSGTIATSRTVAGPAVFDYGPAFYNTHGLYF